jgi:hypothetical protein
MNVFNRYIRRDYKTFSRGAADSYGGVVSNHLFIRVFRFNGGREALSYTLYKFIFA